MAPNSQNRTSVTTINYRKIPQNYPAGWDYYELMKGHDAMIAVPTQLAQVLKALDK
jgi:hypothetical protein